MGAICCRESSLDLNSEGKIKDHLLLATSLTTFSFIHLPSSNTSSLQSLPLGNPSGFVSLLAFTICRQRCVWQSTGRSTQRHQTTLCTKVYQQDSMYSNAGGRKHHLGTTTIGTNRLWFDCQLAICLSRWRLFVPGSWSYDRRRHTIPFGSPWGDAWSLRPILCRWSCLGSPVSP